MIYGDVEDCVCVKRQRTHNTLFMLSSLDGKILTEKGGEFSIDNIMSKVPNMDGIQQYYDIKKNNDLYCFCTAKSIGTNCNVPITNRVDTSLVVIDSYDLNDNSIKILCRRNKEVIIVTTNKKHPALAINDIKNLTVLKYIDEIDFIDLFSSLKSRSGNITIQCSSMLNYILLRHGLIDEIDLIVAPILIGGETAPSLIGGKDIKSIAELCKCSLTLLDCSTLRRSFIRLRYKVNH
jgi:riboflavin biosynthesis pyrimidine reductase